MKTTGTSHGALSFLLQCGLLMAEDQLLSLFIVILNDKPRKNIDFNLLLPLIYIRYMVLFSGYSV